MNDQITDGYVFKQLLRSFEYQSLDSSNQEIINRGFVCSKIKKAKALFVGINPSFLSGSTSESYQYHLQDAINDYPKHYGKFAELVKDTIYENDWSYIDLFQFRETDQKKIHNFTKNDPQFIVEQLRLTYKIIQEINPDILIVCNSGAADFFGINKFQANNVWMNVWLGFNFNFDNDLGIDVINSLHQESILDNNDKRLIGKPVLFTSTLTYMSRFDKRRLNWQIKRTSER